MMDDPEDRFHDEVKGGDLRTEAHRRAWALANLRRRIGRWPTRAELYATDFRFPDEVTDEERAEGDRLRAKRWPGFRVWPR